MSGPGVYGKLPTHGDFIQRNLPSAFVRQWDVWLQHFVAGAKEKMGGEWLDIYLTSPIWRFVLSHGVVDEGRWAGILMPSVDQVGRYFPFTIAVRLPDNQNPLEFMSLQTSWFTAIEELALRALNAELLLDELVEELAGVQLHLATAYACTGMPGETYAMQIDMQFEEQSAAAAYPFMLDALLVRLMSSYSLWSTTGSERVAPCAFDVQGLPPVAKLPAMLDGQWQQWGWARPYTLQA
jgi:type VI secretion system protein ImpM